MKFFYYTKLELLKNFTISNFLKKIKVILMNIMESPILFIFLREFLYFI